MGEAGEGGGEEGGGVVVDGKAVSSERALKDREATW